MRALTTTPALGRWDVEPAARAGGGVGDGIASVLAFLGMPDIVSFAGGFPDPETFPRDRVATLFAEFAASGEATAFQYAPTRGLAGTLDVLGGRLERLEGRRPAEQELLVTSGAIEALELIAKSFLDPGDLVVLEGPTYLGAIQAFRSFEAALEAVPLDENGLDVEELERRLRGGARPKLVYTIPDHQNPAGVTLALDRRELLVELARSTASSSSRTWRTASSGSRVRRSRASGTPRRTSSSRRARRRRPSSPASGWGGRWAHRP